MPVATHVRSITVPLALIGADTEAPVVAVSHDLEFLVEEARTFAARNAPTSSKVHVDYDGTTMLMSYDLYGWHPLRDERVCVVGVSDRHYLAREAAEEAWFQFNTNVFLAELMRTRRSPLEPAEGWRREAAA